MVNPVRRLRPPRRADHRERRRGQSVVEFALVLPLMLILLLAIVDLARVYTTMLSVESAAREAADFGTTLGAEKWQAGQMDGTVSEMVRRACIASSNLPDYVGPDTACDNPDFRYCMTPTAGGTCDYPVDPGDQCDDAAREDPCTVTVTLTYDFHLLAPLNIEFFGVRIGLPSTLTFERDSTFAMTDIDLAPAPGP